MARKKTSTGPTDATGPKMTLAEIATEADVSISSVSKVVNGRPGVSDETRRRIEGLLHDKGYRPRGSGSYDNVIEVVFYELSSEWLLEILQGVEAVATAQGYRIMLTPSHDLLNIDQEWTDEVIARRPAGVILVFPGVEEYQAAQLRSRAIPFVVIDPAGEQTPEAPYVGAQNWAGGLAATEHLIALGHTDIAIITGPKDQNCSKARLSGYMSAMAAAGLKVSPQLVRPGWFHHEDGLAQARALLDLPHPPTAIFACADLQAMGVYEAVAEKGLRVPEDVSVVGFDDLNLARWAGPPLTTVHQPIREMAQIATRMVIDPTAADHSLDLATRLVVRQSTARPRS